ncbi:collagen alpha-2(VIII) chain-like [Mytilus californianus]|uniref:collagen alpha-2(VIII) chain-like n=1 Tax=Mytilus californianus TaxID=6549 RepID=UPI002246B548|nr:collagen alpha-2(VIII) chain-like [Mytilus californianus]
MFVIQLISLLLTAQLVVVNSSCSSKLESSLFDDLIGMMLKLKGTEHRGLGKEMKQKETPAFSVYRDAPQSLSPSTIVKFNRVWTNNLKGYDVTTGIFTAPMAGLYHFSAVVMSESGKSLFLHLWHNDSKMTGSFITGDGYKTGTFDVVLNVKKRDRIYIRCRNNTSQKIYSDSDNYSTFSGYLIA